MRRIAVELKRPFFEIKRWPVSELAYWAAHFTLEHEEYEAAQNGTSGNNVTYVADDDAPDDLKNNTVMALF